MGRTFYMLIHWQNCDEKAPSFFVLWCRVCTPLKCLRSSTYQPKQWMMLIAVAAVEMFWVNVAIAITLSARLVLQQWQLQTLRIWRRYQRYRGGESPPPPLLVVLLLLVPRYLSLTSTAAAAVHIPEVAVVLSHLFALLCILEDPQVWGAA